MRNGEKIETMNKDVKVINSIKVVNSSVNLYVE